jgi:CHAT domain-containing protein
MLTWMHRLLPRGVHRLFWCGVMGLTLALGVPVIQAIAQSSPNPAQVLIDQGQQEFERGNFSVALEHWQQAEQRYRQTRNTTGEMGARLNQAKAWLNAGFYRRAKTLLEATLPQLDSQPPSELKGAVLLEYGNVLRLIGDSDKAKTMLQAGLANANQLQSVNQIQASQFQMGNLLLANQQYLAALDQFQKAAAVVGEWQLSAQLRQVKVLQELKRWPDAIALVPAISAQLTTLPANSRAIYTRIEWANLLTAFPASANLSRQAADLLATAIQQARSLGNKRAESYATGRLGHVYEQTGQWAEAKQLTQTALQLAKQLNSPEIAYQWEWQLGRILKAQQDIPAAIASYNDAVQVLRSLRQDLTGLAPDVQFSFRDQVEPVYRELVDLLLQPDAGQPQLKQARQVVESLQLAELNNFFREACLDTEARQVDEIDPTAATIYPVILRDRLEVILAIPGQPLRHVATPLPQATIEAGIQQMRTSMRRTSFVKEQLAANGQVYRWLIQPIAADLQAHQIKTLVFVLDGSLRNIPMAALYDGNQYLIEQYQIAITPSLQLFGPRRLATDQIRALVAGLSEGSDTSVPLPGVKREVELLQQKLSARILLNQNFTSQALKQTVTDAPFTLVHLATHGQFGSEADKTFIETWNGRLTVNELQELLNRRSLTDTSAIELLVLSACQTAEGDNRAALGMAGLAIRAGARSTLATLWAVNDDGTVQFIREFYQALLQPQTTKAEAVRTAQLSMLNSPEFKHPYFWAPFILVGNWL